MSVQEPGALPAPASFLAEELTRWYRVHGRSLPWRTTRDPYRIWLSEVMLQQTRVDTVIPYYERFLARFPTLAHLAAAEPEEVLQVWEGLGYYRRALHLHQAVREVATRYGGEVPADPSLLAQLPGVGAYTAGAIASLAFGQPVPAVDVNVHRVLSRLVWGGAAPPRAAGRQVAEVAAQLVRAGDPRVLNQALMDLGATVCTPRRPSCPQCPWHGPCRGRQERAWDRDDPVRRAPPPVEHLAVLVARWEDRVVLERRPAGGLLGGLFGLPARTVPSGETEEAARALVRETGQPEGAPTPLPLVRHAFSHRRWVLHPWVASFSSLDLTPEQVLLPVTELARVPVGRPHRRVLELAFSRPSSLL